MVKNKHWILIYNLDLMFVGNLVLHDMNKLVRMFGECFQISPNKSFENFFSYGSFSEAVSNIDYVAQNDREMDKCNK
jgi:hypothetical protein